MPFLLGIGLFVFWFLVNFEPYGINWITGEGKYIYLAGYGVTVGSLLIFTQIIVPTYLPKIFDEQFWTVGKQFAYLLFVVSMVMLGCFVYFHWYYSGMVFSVQAFLLFYLETFSLALFPVVGLVLFDYFWMLNKYRQPHQKIQETSMEPEAAVQQIILKDENKKETLTLAPSDLYYLKSANNYLEIFYLENQTPKKRLLRNTLTNIQQQIPAPYFVKCHRSYLVNQQKIKKITGNAQGYKLHLDANDWVVPVARSKSHFFVQKKI